ncbi:MAG: hypothetical protein JST75_03255 [Bacteroidetes bacterium]|nr:hypothetical protein [Bacteroidota bacterium]
MKEIKKYSRYIITISIIVSFVFLFTKCIDKEKEKTVSAPPTTKVNFDEFAGSDACISCHKNIYNKHILTAHYLTTRPALEKYIKGSFEPGKNKYVYDSNMTVMMEKRDSGFFQVGYYQGIERITKRFDIIFGSASKGQTYATRFKNRIYQLPVSYFTAAKQWANSPQFPTHPVIFNRPITSRCLECHSTFAQKISAPGVEPEEFNRDHIIYGVDCEKCHGPAAKHVAFQTQNPTDTVGKYIINPAKFTREQKLDLCGLCHGGRLQKTTASFQFTAGDKLTDYFNIDQTPPNPDSIDVHGNQFGLLRASKCFKMSTTMTCITCHNTHENERGQTALFSQRCMSCHNDQTAHTCKMTATIGNAIKQDCINCHMPLKSSNSITELIAGQKNPTAAMIRSHFIAIYPDETKKIMTTIISHTKKNKH